MFRIYIKIDLTRIFKKRINHVINHVINVWFQRLARIARQHNKIS